MLKITIDPGHVQGANVGVCNGYREGTAMYYLAQELAAALGEYAGVETALTRRSLADNPSLDARGKTAVRNGSEVFLSLHSDASANRNARGVTVVRSLRRPESAALGKVLANAVNDILGCGKSPYAGNAGGVWTRAYPGYSNITGSLDYYGVIRSAVTGAGVKYAYLIEHSFHTNPTDCTQLDGASVRKRLADAEAAAIARHFGLRKGSGNTAGTADSMGALGASVTPYTVRVKEKGLIIRTGPGTNFGARGTAAPGVYTIVAESGGAGAALWGRLKSGAGWIALDDCKRV